MSGQEDGKSPDSSPSAPDAHLNALRRALADGNAAVMIGSGFSRNAEGGSNVGTWEDLARALASGMSNGAINEAFNAANATQLAEQYERMFSRTALEKILREVVPDERLIPGHLHLLLLSLPWSEVLTTNYDTLLERAAESLLDASYVTVSSREDIPQSKILNRRRIVKLHGSFPSRRPFIVTEEDYRTYPTEFAPFVNLVRQSILENSLCLIGFSGDDPNFLHWIGWVRDMQDRHALPIYLMLARPPSRGQQMLLEARGVTPVLLPASDSGEDSDYEGKYKKLFEVLREPLAGNVARWGDVPFDEAHRKHHDADEEAQTAFLSGLHVLTRHRRDYPGWFIAPSTIRRRLETSVQSMQGWGSEKRISLLEEEDAAVALVALELYSWVQGTVLRDMDDTLAKLALRVLRKTAGLHYSATSTKTRSRLEEFRIDTQNGLASTWTELALAVLAWSRQGHWQAEYREVWSLLRRVRKDDAVVLDHLAYHEVLDLLHMGARADATKRLSKWRVQGSDLYMEVQRAVLLAEVGHIDAALTGCDRAVQLLRQHQKLRPDDLLLLSKESWACLVATSLHRSVEQLERFGMRGEPDDEAAIEHRHASIGGLTSMASPSVRVPVRLEHKGEIRSSQLDDRRRTIDSKGYSSKEELDNAVATLNVERGVPYARSPDFGGFDLGATASQAVTFTFRAAHNEKVQAAQTWLLLAERVGLTPRAGRTRFFDGEFLQAAWWVRASEADPLRRGLGILLRCMREEPLKARDESLPLHQSGWLSRTQVACLDATLAEAHVERFVALLESRLTATQRVHDYSRELVFFTKVLGRLVIRVEDEAKVFDWAERLVAMHHLRGMQGTPECWGPISHALVQCVEALSPPNQRRILYRVLGVPPHPPGDAREHYRSDWVDIYALRNAINELRADEAVPEIDWRPSLDGAIEQLRREEQTATKGALWLRLFVSDELGLLQAAQREEVGRILWKSWDGETWPQMEGFYPNASLRWPPPRNVPIDEEFRKHLLRQSFRPFSSGGYHLIAGNTKGRSWHLPGDFSMSHDLHASMRQAPWGTRDLVALVEKFEQWFASDAEELRHGVEKHADLAKALVDHLQAVDDLLAMSLLALARAGGAESRLAQSRLWKLYAGFKTLGVPLWRLSILAGLHLEDELQGIASLAELELALSSEDSRQRNSAHQAVSWLLQQHERRFKPIRCVLLDRVVANLASSDAPTLAWALEILSSRQPRVWREHLSLRHLYLMDAALQRLHTSLSYASRPSRDGEPDDDVPFLRFKCAQMAYAMQQHSGYKSPAVEKWLGETPSDPLPELRFGKFRTRVGRT